MYGKRFLLVSRIGVYIAVIALVGVTLFGTIAPASPMLERTKRDLERASYRWRLLGADTWGEGGAVPLLDVDGEEY